MLKLSSQDHTNSRTAVVAPDCLKMLFPTPGCSLCGVQLDVRQLYIKDVRQASGWKWPSWAQEQHHFKAGCVTLAMQHPSGTLPLSAFQRQLPWPPWEGLYLFIVLELITFPNDKYHTLNLLLKCYLSLVKILPPCLVFLLFCRKYTHNM